MPDLSLLDWRPPEPQGATYVPARDKARLCAQGLRVFAFVKDGLWHTLAEISAATGDPQASVSARLRSIRKSGHTVERRHVINGLHEYRVSQEERASCPTSLSAESSASSSPAS